MSYLVFDTETNGLPITKGFRKFHEPHLTKYYDTARVIQVSWAVFDRKDQCIAEHDLYIQPDGFSVPNADFHGITEEILREKGVPIKKALAMFLRDVKRVDVIVAHNLQFDYHVLMSECLRAELSRGAQILREAIQFCTMTRSVKLLKIPNRYHAGYKYPSLKELNQFYFQEDVEGAHNAKFDVDACARCFQAMQAGC